MISFDFTERPFRRPIDSRAITIRFFRFARCRSASCVPAESIDRPLCSLWSRLSTRWNVSASKRFHRTWRSFTSTALPSFKITKITYKVYQSIATLPQRGLPVADDFYPSMEFVETSCKDDTKRAIRWCGLSVADNSYLPDCTSNEMWRCAMMAQDTTKCIAKSILIQVIQGKRRQFKL